MNAQLRRELEAHVDLKYREKIQQLVPGGVTIMGVRVPVVRELAKRHKDLPFDEVVRRVDAAFTSGSREEMLLGVFMLARFKKQLSSGLWRSVDGWIESIDNWEVCDQLAMGVAAVLVANDPTRISDLEEWTRSTNPWRRRFTLACCAGLNQGGRSFGGETLRVCERLLCDSDASVQKAVGWALREASKTEPDAVFALLRKRADDVPPRVLREGSEKLPTARRAALMKAR